MRKSSLLILFLIFPLVLSGCISLTGNKKTAPEPVKPVGFYKSVDGGITWASKSYISSISAKTVSFSGKTVLDIIIDPNDNKVLYVTTDVGMYYSMDQGESWLRVNKFGTSYIADIAVDYFNNCTIYAAIGNKIYKSTDCTRNWDDIYIDNRTGAYIDDLATDFYNKDFVYAATTREGEYALIKSEDGGQTWKTKKYFKGKVAQILLDKNDSRILYVATTTKGLYKTNDGGNTWVDTDKETDINRGLKDFKDSKKFSYLVQDMTTDRDHSFIFSSTYGLLRTEDGGDGWNKIPLITPSRSIRITAVAIDPQNADNLYYSTSNTIYKSVDGGSNWSTHKSPAGGPITIMMYDPEDSKIIYLGSKPLPKKK